MKLTVSPISQDDVGIITNYIIDEYKKYRPNAIDVYKIGKRIEFDIRDYTSIKIEDENKTILGFSIFNNTEPNSALLISYYVNENYRHTKVAYLLALHTSEILKQKEKTFYFPINQNHDELLPKRYCVNYIANMKKLYEDMQKISSRWT